MFFGRKASVRHWGVFGCDAFRHVPKEQREVFAPKMERCIYLGHDAVQNCGSVYVMRTKKIVQTRDLAFRPTSLTHCAALVAGDAQVEALLASTIDGAMEMQIIPSPSPESEEAGLQGRLRTSTLAKSSTLSEFWPNESTESMASSTSSSGTTEKRLGSPRPQSRRTRRCSSRSFERPTSLRLLGD